MSKTTTMLSYDFAHLSVFSGIFKMIQATHKCKIYLFTTMTFAEYYTENRRNTCKIFRDFYDQVT